MDTQEEARYNTEKCKSRRRRRGVEKGGEFDPNGRLSITISQGKGERRKVIQYEKNVGKVIRIAYK